MPLTITVRTNGPYLISADDAPNTIIVDPTGAVFPPNKPGKAIALCRCGASATKPFCDGTHNKIGFVGTETLPCAPDADRTP
jgi:CDGSH-type Zn-finger protein